MWCTHENLPNRSPLQAQHGRPLCRSVLFSSIFRTYAPSVHSASEIPTSRTPRRKMNSELLQPCSRKRGDSAQEDKEKSKLLEVTEQAIKDETVTCGIPLAVMAEKSSSGVTFVLEKASLALAYVGKRYQILNPDEHAGFLRKHKKDPYNYRPDIVHEALLQIMDSRLCMAGRLRAVYIKTDEGQLIKVEGNTKIPRTLQSFCTMMAELLQKLSIKASGGRGKLLRLVENPVTKHLPANACKIGLSFSSSKTAPLRDYVASSRIDQEFVFVVGVMAHGKIECDYLDDFISVSGYHLSAATCLRRICVALERQWNIR